MARRFRGWADSLQKQIDDKLRPLSQNPTDRRLYKRAIRRRDAANLERGQKALYALAALHANGGCSPELAGLKYKKDIMPLVATRGDGSGYYSYVDTMEYKNDSPQALALQALIDGTPEEREAARLERDRDTLDQRIFKLIKQIPGFFPTPEDIVERMVALACIEDFMTVLEPSAGSAAIADQIRKLYPDVLLECIEINPALVEILNLKGHTVIPQALHTDFLEHPSDGNYDRVVMNPPFEKKQDVAHIKHAHDCLAEGGKLVSVMPFGARPEDGYEWIEERFSGWLDGKSWNFYEIADGAFKSSKTGIRTCLIQIEK